MSYFLCDCWYVSEKIINTFAAKGFHTIGALKTNRMLYPSCIKKKLSEFAALLSVTSSDFHLVTVKNKKYYVYRYEGKLNGIENAVVLLSYPEKTSEIPNHCGHSYARMNPYQQISSRLIMYAGGR